VKDIRSLSYKQQKSIVLNLLSAASALENTPEVGKRYPIESKMAYQYWTFVDCLHLVLLGFVRFALSKPIYVLPVEMESLLKAGILLFSSPFIYYRKSFDYLVCFVTDYVKLLPIGFLQYACFYIFVKKMYAPIRARQHYFYKKFVKLLSLYNLLFE